MTADVNESGRLELGGCDAVDLAAEFGTPLYVYDETTLRQMCREFVTEFAIRYENSLVAYASKAFLNPAIGRLAMEEGLGLDVVSGGELALGKAIEFPRTTSTFTAITRRPRSWRWRWVTVWAAWWWTASTSCRCWTNWPARAAPCRT